MSDDQSQTREPTELEMLKDRARKMNIVFSNNIGVDALKAKINAKMEGQVDNTNADGVVNIPVVATTTIPPQDTAEDAVAALKASLGEVLQTQEEDTPAKVNALTGEKVLPPGKTKTLMQMMKDEQMKLVRIRISCLDPKKKDLPGEVITVANEYLGTVRKYVPFGEFTDDGYHVPYCIYTFLKNRKFLNITTTKDRRNGQVKVNQSWATEFSIEVLDPLTPTEIQRLATAQAAAGSLSA